MVEELSRVEELPQVVGKQESFPLGLIGMDLFPENWQIIKGIQKVEPSPLSPRRIPLMILRANKKDPAKGCFWGLSLSPEEAKGSGGSIESLFKDLCRKYDCPPKKVGGVVVFMEPGVSLLEDLGGDLREIINQLSPGTRLWVVEPHILGEELNREEKKARKDFLREALKLVDSKSVEAVGGLCYSTGRKRIRKVPKPTLLIQSELFEGQK